MAKSFVKKNKKIPFGFLQSQLFVCFLRSLVFLTAPPSLSKTPTDMVKTKSKMIFYNLTMKQTYFCLVNTFIELKNSFKFVVNYFIHKDTKNWLDILFGNNLKETHFPDFYPLKPPQEQLLLPKKCKSVWEKPMKRPLIEKIYINNFLT